MVSVVSALQMSHEMVSSAVKEGSVAIDATCGNGNDTALLARLVGESGTVFAFDIQREAIENTQRLLSDNGLLPRVRLIEDGHEHLGEYVDVRVSAVMFNLGYLPGGSSREVITRPETTLAAMKSSVDLLQPGGLLTAVIYTGHPGGVREREAVLAWCRQLDQELFTAVHYGPLNQRNDPPSLIAVRRCR